MSGDLHNCPACGAQTDFLMEWHYSGLNDSIFNYVANYFTCVGCGLVYVDNISDERLAEFYNAECTYHEKAHFEITSPENLQKYRVYRQFLTEAGFVDRPMVDVGCGRGGFLQWLNQNGWQANLIGVDIDLKSLPPIQETNSQPYLVNLKEGKALALPFADQTQELLSYFHVLEHIRNLDKVFDEADRVLQEGGYLLIEVPDAEHYHDRPVGTAFWFGIREHVNHFSASSLVKALQRHKFQVLKISHQILPTPEFAYPSLMILAQKAQIGMNVEINVSQNVVNYAEQSLEALREQAENIQVFRSSYQKVTFWGCSSELFSLLPLLTFQDFVLCDASPIKQHSNYHNRAILAPQIVPKEGVLVIAPYLFGAVIEQAALALGWEQDKIFRLN